jgi:predicted ribosome quality control (RQC) complex YloA/Tae2 family protein
VGKNRFSKAEVPVRGMVDVCRKFAEMTSNYFTLARIVDQLQPLITGRRLTDAYSVRPNELRLIFENSLTLAALLRPIDGALFFLQGAEPRPQKNVRSFFKQAIGYKVDWIEMSEMDRQLTLRLSADGHQYDLTLSYFGQPNACLAHNDQLIECFKKRGLEKFVHEIRPISSVDERLGKKLMREAEFRFQLYGQDLEMLAVEIMQELRDQHTAYLYQKGDDFLMSPLKLLGLEANDWVPNEYPSTNEAVHSKIVLAGRVQRLRSKRASLLTGIIEQIERDEKQLSDMRRGFENSERAERYANIGNALMAAAATMSRGLELANLEIEGQLLEVKLDPAKTAFENAKVYFDRSRESRNRKQELIRKSQEIQGQLTRLLDMKEAIEQAQGIRSLEQIEKAIRPEQKQLPKQKNNSPSFRRYLVAGGLTVLVGKNAKQNDELTTKFAKKDDLWLHARGVPGSHVVLQSIGAKNKQIPKEAIEQAAEIAAYFSEARTQTVAPVSYTPRKFVRKPKGANPGAVIVEREEVMMVKPQIRGKEL